MKIFAVIEGDGHEDRLVAAFSRKVDSLQHCASLKRKQDGSPSGNSDFVVYEAEVDRPDLRVRYVGRDQVSA